MRKLIFILVGVFLGVMFCILPTPTTKAAYPVGSAYNYSNYNPISYPNQLLNYFPYSTDYGYNGLYNSLYGGSLLVVPPNYGNSYPYYNYPSYNGGYNYMGNYGYNNNYGNYGLNNKYIMPYGGYGGYNNYNNYSGYNQGYNSNRNNYQNGYSSNHY